MQILFTRNEYPLSRIVRRITGEPVSHCAILDSGTVHHMSLWGTRHVSYEEFQRHQEIVFRVQVEDRPIPPDRGYDYGALLYLGLRFVIPYLPKANLWQTTGMDLCTEYITESLDGEEDHESTPYQLYLKLSKGV